jgi:dCMP deaminase
MDNLRPSKDDYFMDIAKLVSSRSTCLRKKVGAVIVKDGRIIATGYNGSPRGLAHCETCYREDNAIPSGTRYELCRSIHAETNAIVQCAIHGNSMSKSTIYCTHAACMMCARIMVNAGVERLVLPYYSEFTDNNGISCLDPYQTLWEGRVLIEYV